VWHEHNIKRLHAVNSRIFGWVARTCSHVIAVSEAVARPLRRAGLGEDVLRVVYNGIDLNRYAPDDTRARAARHELGLDERLPGIGLFGQYLPYKGHATLIEAAPLILEKVPGAHFFFVGALENPPYEVSLRAQLAKAGLTDRFTFTGWRADVHDVMRAMDVIVVATLTPEPAALTLMEAMASGRPVVATQTGGTPEIVVDGETGFLFPPADAAALAERVLTLLSDRTIAADMGRRGRRRMEATFGVERHGHQIGLVYEDNWRRLVPSAIAPGVEGRL
jgi:glycosyltransferase involved in cell wall biosynthesis